MQNKTFVGLSLPYETIAAARAKASAAGLSYSALIDLCVRYALQHISDEQLRAYKGVHDNAALPKLERDALKAFDAEIAARKAEGSLGGWVWMTHQEVAKRMGSRRAEAYWALGALKTRGLVVGGETEGELDRHGYPKESIWRLARDNGELVLSKAEVAERARKIAEEARAATSPQTA